MFILLIIMFHSVVVSLHSYMREVSAWACVAFIASRWRIRMMNERTERRSTSRAGPSDDRDGRVNDARAGQCLSNGEALYNNKSF